MTRTHLQAHCTSALLARKMEQWSRQPAAAPGAGRRAEAGPDAGRGGWLAGDSGAPQVSLFDRMSSSGEGGDAGWGAAGGSARRAGSSTEGGSWRAEGLAFPASSGRNWDSDVRVLASVKPFDRAAEKAARCYGGDASRLLDVCRARAGLRGPADLKRFLAAVLEDRGDVRVVRVKDMLRPDASSSAGFQVNPPHPPRRDLHCPRPTS